MPKVSVTAKAGCIYDGIPRRKGVRFDADIEDAKLLRLIGKIDFKDPAPDAEQAPAPTYERADLRAETPTQPSTGRGRHRRRDLTAEA